MEIKVLTYHNSCKPLFKIDLIVWKYLRKNMQYAIRIWFKIDLIVWKSILIIVYCAKY